MEMFSLTNFEWGSTFIKIGLVLPVCYRRILYQLKMDFSSFNTTQSVPKSSTASTLNSEQKKYKFHHILNRHTEGIYGNIQYKRS